MKLSTRARYGLRALIDLGQHGQDSLVTIQDIAQRQGISDNYLEQLMPKLKKAGLISSIRGAQGGYRLGKDPKDISVGEVLRVLEGSLNAVECPGAVEGMPGSCDASDSCVTKLVWKRINEGINNAVDSLSLQELLNESTCHKDPDDAPKACSVHPSA